MKSVVRDHDITGEEEEIKEVKEEIKEVATIAMALATRLTELPADTSAGVISYQRDELKELRKKETGFFSAKLTPGKNRLVVLFP